MAKPDESKDRRTFPHDSLEEALALAQKIQDEGGGRPMNRLLLAEAIAIKPSSASFRSLLSSAYKYGLTHGNEKAAEIGLTEDIGQAATQRADAARRTSALRRAALQPSLLGGFLHDYSNKKLPSEEMLPKILVTQYRVPKEHASECARVIVTNARYTGTVRDISGSPHVLLDSEALPLPAMDEQGDRVETTQHMDVPESPCLPQTTPVSSAELKAKPIFVGHGKNTAPLQKLENLLSTFQIPYKVTTKEANLFRPIPQKVKDTMVECGSAILIFTKDELFYDADRKEVWRPSENVVHELGAAAFLYGDRIVIFKEKGLHFPTNFQSIGYIEFEVDTLEAKTADLLKELIGFGLVKVMPT